MTRRRPTWTAYGVALMTMGGLLIGVSFADPPLHTVPATEATDAPAIPPVPEPAWVHTCVGGPDDWGCP